MKIRNFLLVLVIGGIITGCGKTTYKKTPGGMPYKVISGNDTMKIHQGDFIKVHFTRTIKDSVDFTTVGAMPVYIPVGAPNLYDISEIWTMLKKGDSIVATQMMDTFIKKNPEHPSFVNGQYKKGDKITISVKILDVFTSDTAAQADEALMMAQWEIKEKENVANFIKGKNINAEKTPSGVYVEILTPGTGNLIDSGNYIAVNYNGTTFGGTKFDSNTDSAFQHVEPLTFNVGTVGQGGMITGFDHGVRLLRKGAKAKLYIPSLLGYGAQPDPRSGIKPYENLIFEIEVLEVLPKAPAKPSRKELMSQ